jgi:hypothetical protein
MEATVALGLAGSALGALGAVLVCFEFFRLPSYVEYDEMLETYSVSVSPKEVVEHGWVGRGGALLVAVGFALDFVATLLR